MQDENIGALNVLYGIIGHIRQFGEIFFVIFRVHLHHIGICFDKGVVTAIAGCQTLVLLIDTAQVLQDLQQLPIDLRKVIEVDVLQLDEDFFEQVLQTDDFFSASVLVAADFLLDM